MLQSKSRGPRTVVNPVSRGYIKLYQNKHPVVSFILRLPWAYTRKVVADPTQPLLQYVVGITPREL